MILPTKGGSLISTFAFPSLIDLFLIKHMKHFKTDWKIFNLFKSLSERWPFLLTTEQYFYGQRQKIINLNKFITSLLMPFLSLNRKDSLFLIWLSESSKREKSRSEKTSWRKTGNSGQYCVTVLTLLKGIETHLSKLSRKFNSRVDLLICIFK